MIKISKAYHWHQKKLEFVTARGAESAKAHNAITVFLSDECNGGRLTGVAPKRDVERCSFGWMAMEKRMSGIDWSKFVQCM